MKVAILGSGPSAAYSAMACDEYSEVQYDVLSNAPPPTFFPGAFWPRVNPTNKIFPMHNVYISCTGNASEYLQKQWGVVREDWLEETSFPKQSRQEVVYSPYDFFGTFWKDKEIIITESLSDKRIAEQIAKEYDWVFMTFATNKSVAEQKSFLINYPIVSYETDTLLNYCIYDGDTHDFMVRMSSLFGYVHWEYSKDYIPKVELLGSGRVTWATDTMPDTPEWDPRDTPASNVTLLGRWAQWSRKILAHDAHYETTRVLEKIL